MGERIKSNIINVSKKQGEQKPVSLLGIGI